ncbi:MAG: tRNA pseudouridine(38-40) synthase TruA [Bacteroidales bacterium]|nr:tRNA pseudouridine(38-40) synthase TruA [Bacteroidales bacterium]
MSRYFIHMAYDGSDYYGWQIQPDKPTVQKVLEHALSILLKKKTAVTGAGRTDAGVHATYFMAHFDLKPEMLITGSGSSADPDPSSDRFLFKLNRFLPPDIVVYKIFPVQEDMHARFSALYRTYQYHISSIKPLFQRNYCHYVYGELDTESIRHCCQIILENSDFTSFAKLHTDVKTNNCKLIRALWNEVENGYVFEITADRFLRNMVRSLTGTLLDVGLGKLDADAFKKIVEAKDRGKASSSAPAQGLFLVDIGYPGNRFS